MEFRNSNPIQLKIKAKTLAKEAVYIKDAEHKTGTAPYRGAVRRALSSFAMQFKYPEPKTAGLTLPPTIGYRVVREAIKHYTATLTPEQRERFERRRVAARAKMHLLHEHRVNVVRREARATHLARAFLMGRAYSDVEQKAYHCPLKPGSPSKPLIEKMVLRYANGDPRVVRQKLEEWLQTGFQYYQQYWKVVNSVRVQANPLSGRVQAVQ